MVTPADIHKLLAPATAFAGEVQDVLNKTVCNGAVVGAVVSWDKDLEQKIVNVGTKLRDLVARPVPLCLDNKKPKCWLEAQYRCDLDDRGRFLMVISSFFGIYAPDGKTLLCHYDYERNKAGYPAAHLQVQGTCPALGLLPGRRSAGELAKLHFPVGGRRYRPTIEDMIEFVLMEGFAEGRDDWERVIADHRIAFQEKQLSAAVRRRPDIARAVLADIDGLREGRA
ncbi:hypothetical protein [Jiangella rhizosphaerae]|uniref:Uncharacterized protein n=1 Tax=Jiangella rhizosphaerae TaxID=2293569 RepID=A0A418KMC2_9ACTN|nr:hypothetical protein [Jiangella rhizosphaerae]RIQ19539.1 hypothetical protein DY240_19520 [Jiangella rhizosphaerae]